MKTHENLSDRKAYTQEVTVTAVFCSKLYPVQINVFDSGNHITNTIVIQDFLQFFNFIDALPDETNAAIIYPVLVSDPHGNYTVLRNNAQLETFINGAINTNTNN